MIGKLDSVEVAILCANVKSEMKKADMCNIITEKLKSSGVEIK
jgi:hypothetical protein